MKGAARSRGQKGKLYEWSAKWVKKKVSCKTEWCGVKSLKSGIRKKGHPYHEKKRQKEQGNL